MSDDFDYPPGTIGYEFDRVDAQLQDIIWGCRWWQFLLRRRAQKALRDLRAARGDFDRQRDEAVERYLRDAR